MTVSAADLSAYLRCVEAGRRTEALDVVLGVAERESPAAAITGVLSPAQIEIGHRWERGDWTVSQEYAATSVTDYVLAGLATRWPPTDPRAAPPVAVVCAQGEWHVLAARMFDELLRFHGWDVVLVGGTVPVPELARHLGDVPLLGAAVSCSLPMFLGGARSVVEALHTLGVPVIAGGPAVSPARATSIGADAWAADAADASAVLERWLAEPPRLASLGSPVPLPAAYLEVEAARSSIVSTAVDELMLRDPEASERRMGLQRGRETFDQLVGALAASLLVNDPQILDDALVWAVSMLRSRARPTTAAAKLDALEAALAAVPEAQSALIEACARVA